MKQIFVLMAAIGLFYSCSKELPPQADFESAIVSPSEADVFAKGDTVRINAEIQLRRGEMHGFELYAYDKNDLSVFLSKAAHVHDSVVSIDTFFVNNVIVDTDCVIELRTYMGHLQEADVKNIRIKMQGK